MDTAALFKAAADMVIRGDRTALAATLDEHPALVHATSPRAHGATLLHYSAANGVEDERQKVPPNAVEIADLLIRRGADINATVAVYGGGPGSTPLVALVTGGHPTEAGLMTPVVDSYGRSGQNLNGFEDDGLPMAYAFLFRNVSAAVAAWLVDTGADVNRRMTALHEACWGGHLDVVTVLAEAGADIGAVEEQHNATPAGWARHTGHEHVVAYMRTRA